MMGALAGLLLLGLWTGCSSPPARPPVPPARETAERFAEQAAGFSEDENWAAAAQQWQAAADQFLLLNDRTNAAIALHNLAHARRELGQPGEAQRELEAAASLNERTGQRTEWWRNQIALLQVLAQTGQTNALQARFDRLLPLANELREPETHALFLNELGLWQQTRNELEAAGETFRQAAQLFEAGRDRAGAATVRANQARNYEAQGNYPAALDAWQASLAQFEALADPRGITRALAGQGRTLLAARQDLPVAEDLLRRAARNYRTLKAPAELGATLRTLRQCLEAQGRHREAAEVEAELRELQRAP